MTKKILFFEGAGGAPCGDLENCRIRTAFRNKKGIAIYLELMGRELQYKTFHEYGDKYSYVAKGTL